MGARPKTKILLALQSGGICAMPECRCKLVADDPPRTSPAIVGQAAHIKGEKPGAARYDPQQSKDERNGVCNLIYLCPTCHTKIDKSGNGYSVEKLIGIKKMHQIWLLEFLGKSIQVVSYAELDIVCQAISSSDITESSDFTVVSPREKIQTNKLSERTHNHIQLGLGKAKDVQGYLNNMTRFDSNFGERLKSGFVAKYEELKGSGFSGDELFDLMLKFSQNGSTDFIRQAAGLSVLTYLFHVCDIFEK